MTADGNLKAQNCVAEVFELRDSFEWRGLGPVPYSALQLRTRYARFDAERVFAVVTVPAEDNPACECGAILRGVKKPTDCKLFGTACTPETPMGSCMVSSEGACAAHWTYGRFRDRSRVAVERGPPNEPQSRPFAKRPHRRAAVGRGLTRYLPKRRDRR